MPVPTLSGLCRRTIWANIEELSYVSTLPYFKVRDILKQVKNPSQLAVIEEYSPQIVGEDGELWEAFCKRDFMVPMKRKQYQPKNPQSWRQVYERYAEEEREAEAHALAQLGATYAGLDKMKRENKTSIGNPKFLPKAPASGGMGRSRGKGPAAGSATLSFGGGARTANAVRKAKKEALEVAARKKLSVPKNLRPNSNLAKVTTAPVSMKNEYRIKAQPKFIPPSAPTKVQQQGEMDDDRGQMEARLLAAKRPKVQPKLLSDDELKSSSFKSAEGSKPAVTPIADSRASSTPKKPRGLFSRAHNSSHHASITLKTVTKPTTNAAPHRSTIASKAEASVIGSVATTGLSLTTGKSASLSHPRQSRSESSRMSTAASGGEEMLPTARVSSPAYEGFKLSKMKPRRTSRSPSVTSSIFGTPEPEAPGTKGMRQSGQSGDSRSSSPFGTSSTRPAKRAHTPTEDMVVQTGKAKRGSLSMPKLDEPLATTDPIDAAMPADGAAATQPPLKKKKVDIFMRRKPVAR